MIDRVQAAIDAAPVVDLHTHLFAPEFPMLNLWGIDELLTYHYLVAETLRAEPAVTPEGFFAQTKAEQADLVWESLFVRRTPLSEAASGVLTVLAAFGLDPAAKDLREARAFFAGRDPREHLDHVLELAGMASLTMTNDPLDPAERPYWDAGATPDPRFHAALRLDPLVNGAADIANPRAFLDEWIDRMRPRYVAVSLPDTFTDQSPVLRDVVLPACRDHHLPFAMMIGVRRRVNPRLGPAGDGMGVADLSNLERLAADFPENRFLATTLARENAHALCVAARKFANILPFGCWWFMNNPSLVEETTLLRLEMLGPTFVPQHSDARILEQLIYKWQHSRRAIARALARRYEAMPRPVTDAEIARDARALMGGIASEWMGIA